VIQLRAVFAQRITLLRPSRHQPRTVPVFNGAARLIANHLDLAIFGSAPEVRAFCSAFAAAATPRRLCRTRRGAITVAAV
jgi:hypothetical protein